MLEAIQEISLNEPQKNQPLRLLILQDSINPTELLHQELHHAGINYIYDRCPYDDIQPSNACYQRLLNHQYNVVLCYDRPFDNVAYTILEMLQQIGRRIKQQTPFILITTADRERRALEEMALGMTDYVLGDRLFRLPMVLMRAIQTVELQQQREETIAQLKQQAQREALISHILQAMRKTLVLEDVLQTTLNHLQEILGVTRCLFLRFSEFDFRIRYAGEKTPQREQMYNIRCDLCNFYRDSLTDGQFVIIHNFDRVPPSAQQVAQDFSLSSSILAPLIYDQRCLGLICLHQCDGQREWTENEVLLVKAIAHQCSIAVYQAELYSKAQQELIKREQVEAQLRYEAFHDNLTGLPNRPLLMERLDHALQRAKHQSRKTPKSICPFAILFIDLDHFKDVNDSLGHLVGDRLLCNVVKRLEQCISSLDTIARLGGDEFVVLMEDMTDIDIAMEMAERILQAFAQPFTLNEQDIFISASIGIAPGCSHYDQSAQLLRDADAAMYRAKQRGRNCFEVFDPSMHTQALKRLHLTSALRRGIETQELRVFYQPIISLKTGELAGFEALVRWQHPKQGLISPAEFIPVAEDTGLILAIDLVVLEQACQQLHILQTTFPDRPLAMSVNLSGKQLSQTDLALQIDRILAITGADAYRLKLEITESSIMQYDTVAMEQLQQIKARHIQLLVDDFGTGYSSLSYLQHLPVDILKIDRSFVDDIDCSPTNFKIARTIAMLAHSLNLKIVAEGIETAAQLDLLRHLNCEYGQGYFFSRPIAQDALMEFILRGGACAKGDS